MRPSDPKDDVMIILQQAPWWVFAIRFLAWHLGEHTPSWSLPPIPITANGEKTTIAKEYGDLSWLVWYCVGNPVIEWADKRIKKVSVSISAEKYGKLVP